MTIKKINVSWGTYGKLLNELLAQIKNSNQKYDGVYGVPRGGWPIAVFMSHNLKIPILTQSTDQSLVVDDISDEGITLKNVKNKNIATLYTTPWTTTVPKFSVRTKTLKDTWIIFPYENSATENDYSQQ